MGRNGSTRDFEAPLANLLVGTCELQVYSGHKVYLSVVLDAYSRVILQFIASLENNEGVVLKMVDKVVENLQRPATIYFCQRGGYKNKIYQEYIESQPMLKAPTSTSYISNYINSFFARYMEFSFARGGFEAPTFDDFFETVKSYVDLYNYDFPHASIGRRFAMCVFNYGLPKGKRRSSGVVAYTEEQMIEIRAKAQRLREQGVPERSIAEPRI